MGIGWSRREPPEAFSCDYAKQMVREEEQEKCIQEKNRLTANAKDLHLKDTDYLHSALKHQIRKKAQGGKRKKQTKRRK